MIQTSHILFSKENQTKIDCYQDIKKSIPFYNDKLFSDTIKDFDPWITKINDIYENESLILISSSANLSINEVLKNAYMIKKATILKNYNFPTKPAECDGYYHMRIESKKYKRKTLRELEDIAIEHYLHNRRTLTTVYNDFREYKIRTGTTEATIHKYDTYIEYINETKFGDIPIDDIKALDYVNWATETIIRHAMTIKRFSQVRMLVNQMIQFLIFTGELTFNPIRDINNTSFNNLFVAQKHHEKHEDSLTIAQVKELIDYCEKEFSITSNSISLIPAILVLTGLRVGELLALQYNDFNYSEETLTINKMLVDDYVEKDGKLRKTGSLIKGHAKCRNAGDEDTIFIDSQVLKYISQIRRANGEAGFHTEDDDFIFVRKNKYTNNEVSTLTKRSLDRIMRRISEQLNFDYVYSAHDLRRTYVSMLASAGMPLKDIQKQVRHSTPEMTLKYLRNNQSDEDVKNNISAMINQIKKA